MNKLYATQISVFSLGLFLCVETIAAPLPKGQIFEIRFGAAKKEHVYYISEQLPSKRNPKFQLGFRNEIGRTQKIQIPEGQARSIIAAGTRIIWDAKYRRPASKGLCPQYAFIKTLDAETQICVKDKRNVGKAYGLLNSLRSQFK